MYKQTCNDQKLYSLDMKETKVQFPKADNNPKHLYHITKELWSYKNVSKQSRIKTCQSTMLEDWINSFSRK